jgi:plasmid stability protein
MKTAKSERPISVLVGPELDAVLRARAATNHRSLTKEVVFLIETALGCSSENVRETIHLLYKANVEVTPEATSPLA